MNHARSLFTYASQIFEGSSSIILTEFYFQIAGRKVCLKFSNEQLAAIFCRAFRHLEIEPTNSPELTIWTFDVNASGLGPLDISLPQAISGKFYWSKPTHLLFDCTNNRIDAYDPVRRIGLLCIPTIDDLDATYFSAPYLSIFHWWSHDNNVQLVHAGAVGTEDGCALLVGKAGSGKSTTVLGCIGSTLHYLGDDYCVIEYHQTPTVYTLYSHAKANAQSLRILPHLVSLFDPTEIEPKGKFIAYLNEQVPQFLLQSAPLKAIIVPQIGTPDTPTATQISSSQGLQALAPSTILQLPGNSSYALKGMTQLARNTPCWNLHVGPQPQDASEIIEEIINLKN